MTEEEYWGKKKELESEYKHRKFKLAEEYALSNAVCKKGDFFKNSSGRIGKIIDVRMNSFYSENFPQCTYQVHMLTKKGALSKRAEDIFCISDGEIYEILPEGSVKIKE